MWKNSMRLCAIQFMSYFIFTVNYRAVAAGDYLWTFLTDIAVASMAFFTIKLVVNSHTWQEWMGYVIGGCLGAQLALLVSHYLP